MYTCNVTHPRIPPSRPPSQDRHVEVSFRDGYSREYPFLDNGLGGKCTLFSCHALACHLLITCLRAGAVTT
eukprot:239592-Pyramimonas_sp.AAC.1